MKKIFIILFGIIILTIDTAIADINYGINVGDKLELYSSAIVVRDDKPNERNRTSAVATLPKNTKITVKTLDKDWTYIEWYSNVSNKYKEGLSMKKIFIALLLLLFANVCFANVHVNGYYRSDGTYVKPHYRSNPDGYSYNNYSSTHNNYNSSFSNSNNYIDYKRSYGNYNNYNSNKARYGTTPSTNLGF